MLGGTDTRGTPLPGGGSRRRPPRDFARDGAPAAGAATSIPWGPVLARRVSLRLAAGSTQLRPPKRPTIALSVIEHPATEAPGDGVLLFNPGGPGRAGSSTSRSSRPSSLRGARRLHSRQLRRARHGHEQPASVWTLADRGGQRRPVQRLRRQCFARLPPTVPRSTRAPLRCDHPQRRQGHGQDPRRSRCEPDQLLRPLLRHRPRCALCAALPGPCASHGPRRGRRHQPLAHRQATEEAPAIDAALRSALPPCAAPASCPLGARPLATYSASRAASAAPAARPGGATPPVTVAISSTPPCCTSPSRLLRRLPAALEAAAAGNGAPCERCRSSSTRTSGARRWSRRSGRTPATTPRPTRAPGPVRCSPADSVPRRPSPVRRPSPTTSSGAWAAPRFGHRADAGAHECPTRSSSPRPGIPTRLHRVAQLSAVIGGRLVTNVAAGHTWLLNDSTNACMEGS